MITDEEMVAATRRIGWEDTFRIVDVQHRGESMRVVFTLPEASERFGIDLPLPSTDALKPWLMMRPGSAEDAAGDLGVWLMEEVGTGCTHWGVRQQEDDLTLLFMEPYGIRTTDAAEHTRLLAHTTPPRGHGWHGWIQENTDETRTLPARPLGRLKDALTDARWRWRRRPRRHFYAGV